MSNPKLVFKNQAMLIHELRGINGKVDVVVERNKHELGITRLLRVE